MARLRGLNVKSSSFVSQGRLKVCLVHSWQRRPGLVCPHACTFAMPETGAPAVDFSADADLISFLKANMGGRYRRDVHSH